MLGPMLERLQLFALCLLWILTFLALGIASLFNPEWAKREIAHIARFISNRQAERRHERMDGKWRAF